MIGACAPPLPSLTDAELKSVMDAAALLPVEQRGLFLERVAVNLELSGGRNTSTPKAVEPA